jgi:hypothetical protein
VRRPTAKAAAAGDTPKDTWIGVSIAGSRRGFFFS